MIESTLVIGQQIRIIDFGRIVCSNGCLDCFNIVELAQNFSSHDVQYLVQHKQIEHFSTTLSTCPPVSSLRVLLQVATAFLPCPQPWGHAQPGKAAQGWFLPLFVRGSWFLPSLPFPHLLLLAVDHSIMIPMLLGQGHAGRGIFHPLTHPPTHSTGTA